jgi:catechol 2,3-dioxygenase-like lactoylglutathione lyase family enzyme
MDILQVKETCLYVEDLNRTQTFYEKVLGLSLISKKAGRHVFFNAGTSVLLCFIPESTRAEVKLPPHWAKGPAHLAFEVSRVEYRDWKEKITNAGVEIIHEHNWGDDFHSFYFHDPDGHVLEIVQEGMWEYLAGGGIQ